ENATPSDERVESCAIITTEPNALVAPIHNRMPAILAPDAYEAWLDPENTDLESLELLLKPYPAEEMAVCAVSKFVDNPRNEGDRCIQPIPTRETGKTLDFG
ncbi:MAG TPA: hypothetical protein EYP14_15900, partial [Planctomycetaceae bacterium]|nr:hypothetical protein [Planctomycetaceae bacterium]